VVGRNLDKGIVKLRDQDVKFRIMSYNVLAQNLLEDHPYLYRDSSKEVLEWKYRWDGLRREVEELEPDLVCLQEVQFKEPDYFESCYLPFFKNLGYRYVAKARTGDKKDGCVIFYKSSVFTLDVVSKLEYKIGWVSVLDRDNVALVCRLIPVLQPDSPIVVATTHLLYNPKRDDIRLAQTALLLAEVDRLATPPVCAARQSYLPVLINGDFNCDPTSPIFKLMSMGRVKYAGWRNFRGKAMPAKLLPESLGMSDSCQWQVKLEQRGLGSSFETGTGSLHHNLHLISTYPIHPGVTTFQDCWTLVDYLFYSSDPRLQLLSKQRLPTAKEMDKIPSLVCPSDHLPLVADFLLTP